MRLEIDAFQSYREPTVVDLDGIGAACIIGANYSGKTSLLDALAWALYGRSRGSTADSVVSYSASRCRVAVEFEVGGQVYMVERQRDRTKGGTSSLELMRSEDVGWVPAGSDRISESQAVIDKLIGLNFETWQATSFIGQGKADAFTRMRPAERKDLLAEVLELGLYEALAERAKEDEKGHALAATTQHRRAESLGQRIEELSTAPDELDSFRVAAEKVASEVADEEVRMEAAREALDEARGRVAAAKVNEALWGEYLQARDLADAEIDSAPDLETCETRVKQALILAEHAHKQAEGFLAEQTAVREDSRLAGLGLGAAKADDDAAQAALTRFADLPERCPTCGQSMDLGHRAQVLNELNAKAVTAGKARIVAEARWEKQATAEEEAAKGLYVAQREEKNARDVLEEAKADLGTRQRHEEARVVAGARAEALKARGVTAPENSHRDEMAVENRLVDVEEFSRRLRELGTKQNAIAREIGLAEGKVAALEQATRDQAEAALLASEHEERRHVADLAAKACGRDGIPARLIEAAIPEIEERANEILAALMGELTVTLESTRATKTAGVRETLDIIVIASGEERPLEELSGSERASVDLALRLGLSMMLASRAGAGRPDCLFIDEGFTAFDTEHRQAVPGILRRLAAIFPMVLLVTHEQLFADAFDSRIVVTRGPNGSSTVTVEAA